MNCRKVWTEEFLKNFTKVFWEKEYRIKRENDLFNEEKVFLPPLQEEAERLIQLQNYREKIEGVTKKIMENNNNEDQLVRDQRIIHKELSTQQGDLQKQYNILYRKPISTEKKVFVMKCVVEDCRGFLDDKYKCGLCSTVICKSCHHQKNEEHKCNKDDVATVEELEKTTKPCPKCQTRIYKTDGCDQMFCIMPSCHTAFSWKTGLIDTGVIHNPEYFRALREGNIQDHRHRQHQGPCGPLPLVYTIDRMLVDAHVDMKTQDSVMNMFQRFVHLRAVILPLFLIRGDNKERLKYLTGEYDEKKFKQKVYIRHQTFERRQEERQIMESYVSIGEEMFRGMTTRNIPQTIVQLTTLTDLTHAAIVSLDKKHKYAGLVKPKDIINV